jgi:antitoxin component HigA of HigAB toxin-antitoxin module
MRKLTEKERQEIKKAMPKMCGVIAYTIEMYDLKNKTLTDDINEAYDIAIQNI